jgi:transcriptional regulator with XRE-family HTH domain
MPWFIPRFRGATMINQKRSSRVIMTDEARVLRQMRMERNLSMRKAGTLMGWSDTFISHIEHGRVDVPEGPRLEKMLVAYENISRKSFIERVRRFRLERQPSDELTELITKLSKEQVQATLILLRQYLR